MNIMMNKMIFQVMQRLQESGGDQEAFAANDPGADVPQDFTMDELYLLKAVFLKFEEVIWVCIMSA
jgi:hypothetical protein